VVAALSGLDHHLAGERPGAVAIDLQVKDRDTAQQHVTLLCHVDGLPEIVATADDRELPAALTEVRREAVRQLEDAHARREPHHRS
jgi:hypothetical protein